MDKSYWHKQTTDKPLFPDLAWSRPENKRQAGKLLIVGGNLHGFASPAEAYAESVRAGVGTARAMLPDCLRKIVGVLIENAEYAPCTPSGSFSQKALSEVLDPSNWADATLFAGDLGRNSETAILIEKFLAKARLPPRSPKMPLTTPSLSRKPSCTERRPYWCSVSPSCSV